MGERFGSIVINGTRFRLTDVREAHIHYCFSVTACPCSLRGHYLVPPSRFYELFPAGPGCFRPSLFCAVATPPLPLPAWRARRRCEQSGGDNRVRSLVRR